MKFFPFENLTVVPKSSLGARAVSEKSYVFLEATLDSSQIFQEFNDLSYRLAESLSNTIKSESVGDEAQKNLLKSLYINFKFIEITTAYSLHVYKNIDQSLLPMIEDQICIILNDSYDYCCHLLDIMYGPASDHDIDYFEVFEDKKEFTKAVKYLMDNILASQTSIQIAHDEYGVPTNLFFTAVEYIISQCPELRKITKISSDGAIKIEDNTMAIVVRGNQTIN